MYVTRPLSLYKRDVSALSRPPPEGPNSGVLVIEDEESQTRTCFGLFRNRQVKDLPFPQNKNLTVWFPTGDGVSLVPVAFIPVINQPLSSNRYYAIEISGKDKGKAHVNSKEEDKKTCCCFSYVSDKKPVSLDLHNINQQFEISKRKSSDFVARSVAADGFPPEFLRIKGWRVETSSKHEFLSNEAPGLDAKLRRRLPNFDFPLSVKNSRCVRVGKWYTPFIFIQEGSLKNQVNDSRYYEVTLDQRWEKIFECKNSNNAGNSATVDAAVDVEVVGVGGNEARADRSKDGGVVWFRSVSKAGGEASVGLSVAVVERMKWEEERFGWSGGEKRVKVRRVEEYGGKGEWESFGCYVLVERFLIKRPNGSVVLSYEFKHTNQVKTKWE